MAVRFADALTSSLVTLLVVVMFGPNVEGADPTTIRLPAGYQLHYQQSFDERGAFADFEPSDPKAWTISFESDNGALELTGQSDYKPAVRSPVNIALVSGQSFGDFVLEADFLQTGKEYGHRDMCAFFGFQKPDQFYYAHIATAADDHAHNIFVVNKQPRTKIAQTTTKGVDWGLGIWHKLRIERTLQDGAIRVFFDNLETPVMVAQDKTFATGQIGFGSFDDTGKIDNIRIWAPSVQKAVKPMFSPGKQSDPPG